MSEEVGKAAMDAMKSTPTAIALLVINVVFLAFTLYVLSEISSSSTERNKAQMELIDKLVGCQQGPKQQ